MKIAMFLRELARKGFKCFHRYSFTIGCLVNFLEVMQFYCRYKKLAIVYQISEVFVSLCS